MKIEYDKNADAAYIYLTDFLPPRIEKTYLCDPQEVDGMINLDFVDGKLVGIEIIDASKKLPKEILDQAEIIGK